jgi:predicted esterase
MAQVSLTLEIHRKWWVIPSTHVLSVMCRVTGYAPNLDRLASWYASYGFELVVDGKRTRLGAI